MNAPTQITMDPKMQRRAEARAAELGISLAEYIRRAVELDLGEARPKQEPRPKVDISVVFNLGASDEPTDIASDKDKMIGEAVWDDYLRSTGQKPRRPADTKATG
jgi:hypothetical protein